MKIFELLIGLAAGAAGGYYYKGMRDGGNGTSGSNPQAELNNLSDENEKLRKRNKDAERQIEDMLSELEKLRRVAKESSNNQDDLEDDLADAKNELKKLKVQNSNLLRKVSEYEATCQKYEEEIATLKRK